MERCKSIMEIEYYRGVAIMHNPINNDWYFYPVYNKGARRYKTVEAAQDAIDELTTVKV